ncbi:MAG: hypothetical protein RLZZ59_56 [Pseudomonadota bacterium]|jgi:lipoyl(octanoyl) transferase
MVEWQVIPGFSDYQTTVHMMEKHMEKVILGEAEELIILTEHKDVYTAGSSYDNKELLKHDIPVVYTGRGGKFTYHGPGQRVIYPILNLASKNRTKDLKKYIQNLEEWMILTLRNFGIDAFIVPERVGIWLLDRGKEKKIGAIGVRVRKWITYHGVAINISTDLKKFEGIIPCGISEFGVTSLEDIGVKITMEEFDQALRENFANIFL